MFLSLDHPSLLHMVVSCQMTSVKKRLSRVQRLACLGITGAMHTTSTGAMEALTGPPSLDLAI